MTYDLAVIGGGVVGMWVALEGASRGAKVVLIESGDQLAGFASRRNSGVLHAGIYYPNNSLKHKLCLQGRKLSVEFLKKHHIPYNLCGKWIVPITTQKPAINHHDIKLEDQLYDLYINAKRNGVDNIYIKNIDPVHRSFLNCKVVLSSEDTGIVNLPVYMQRLAEVLAVYKVKILVNHQCVAATQNIVECEVKPEAKSEYIDAHYIVNAAGLYADKIASYFGLDDYHIKPNKGVFFQLKKPLPINKLVYPLPHNHSTHLGLHYTIDVNGNAYVGPDSTWASHKEDYSLLADKKKFYQAMQALFSYYKIDDLMPTKMVGLRARLFKDDNPVDDFVIARSPKSVFHLLGIESPGLTSSPAIAKYVLDLIAKGSYYET